MANSVNCGGELIVGSELGQDVAGKPGHRRCMTLRATLRTTLNLLPKEF